MTASWITTLSRVQQRGPCLESSTSFCAFGLFAELCSWTRKLDLKTLISFRVLPCLTKCDWLYSQARNLYSHPRNPYSHAPEFADSAARDQDHRYQSTAAWSMEILICEALLNSERAICTSEGAVP